MRTVQTSEPSPQDTGSFRKLVEQKITIEQYVRDLERRSSELREGVPREEQDQETG